MNNIISLLTVCLMLAGTYLTQASKLFAGDGPASEGAVERSSQATRGAQPLLESAGGSGHDSAIASPPSAVSPPNGSPGLAATLGIMFVDGSTSTLLVERDGRKYIVDLVARSVREAELPAREAARKPQSQSTFVADQSEGASVFKQKCSTCHGPDGRGLATVGTPNFTDPKVQASLTDEEIVETIKNGKKDTLMPAWAGKLSYQQISAVAGYVRSLGSGSQPQQVAAPGGARSAQSGIYEPGDDVLMTLPTGRRLDRHGFYVNFSHRFAYDPAFSGTARGGALAGLDGFSLSSFGFRYGVTRKLSVSIWRSPTFIARPIQMMAAYNLMDEHDKYPFNAAVRVSIDGQNGFRQNFAENLEGIFSRSLTRHAQIYFVPTVSLNVRHLFSPNSFESRDFPNLPGTNTFSLGVGGAVDIRPTVALLAEVIPTLVNGNCHQSGCVNLGIHRPAYAFGIQKKIWRHSFTFGFTNGPATTVSQRSATRAAFVNDPTADTPNGLFIGFDLTRQVY